MEFLVLLLVANSLLLPSLGLAGNGNLAKGLLLAESGALILAPFLFPVGTAAKKIGGLTEKTEICLCSSLPSFHFVALRIFRLFFLLGCVSCLAPLLTLKLEDILSKILVFVSSTVSGQEAHEPVHLHEPSQAGAHAVSVAPTELPMVASSVLGAESWLRTHVLARYPSKHITTILVGHGVACSSHGHELVSLRLSHAAKNLHHSLVRWGLAEDIKITAVSTVCAAERGRAALSRRLYGRHHLPPSPTLPSPQPPAGTTYSPPPPSVPLSFAPNSPPEVVPSLPPTAAAPASSPVAVPASPPSYVSTRPPFTFPSSPPPSVPASPPEATGGIAPTAMPPPCLAPAPPAAAMSPPPWSGEGGNAGGFWCVAKPTVPEDKLQEAMDYACSQDGVDCQEIAAGGSCFYPDNIASHASYAFNSYWQKMKRIGGSCNFGGTAVLIHSDPSYLQCRFILS